jgi:hypothetical protein
MDVTNWSDERARYQDAPELLWAIAMTNRALHERADDGERAILREMLDALDRQLLARLRSCAPAAGFAASLTEYPSSLSLCQGECALRS